MQSFPHHYSVDASATAEGAVLLSSKGLDTLSTAAPLEFGGPGDVWSPETLLVAAVVDCFVLTFRAVARASSVDWTRLRCEGEGKLDRVDGQTRFVEIKIQAKLTIPADGDAGKAERLLQKAEHSCLVSSSLACPVQLDAHVDVE